MKRNPDSYCFPSAWTCSESVRQESPQDVYQLILIEDRDREKERVRPDLQSLLLGRWMWRGEAAGKEDSSNMRCIRGFVSLHPLLPLIAITSAVSGDGRRADGSDGERREGRT